MELESPEFEFTEKIQFPGKTGLSRDSFNRKINFLNPCSQRIRLVFLSLAGKEFHTELS